MGSCRALAARKAAVNFDYAEGRRFWLATAAYR
jgi:hypothetical protein